MKYLLSLALLFASVNAWAQSPQLPSTQVPTKPQPPGQPPPPQLYQLVPVQQPVQQPVQYVQQPVQYVQQPVQQLQYVQQPVNVQTVGFSAQATGQRTVVLGPGPVSLSLAWVGQRMAGMGKTHIWTINHSVVRPVNPIPQPAPPVQYVTVSMPQPVVQPPVQVQVVTQPQPTQQLQIINAPSEAAPPPPVVPVNPTPTPQAQSQSKHPLFGWGK